MKKVLLLFVTVALISGCGIFKADNQMVKSVDELVLEASSAFMAGDYDTAVEAYTDLKDWYPFSRYAILAELKIADSYYHLEEYELAIAAYEDFERLHPRNEAIPYVIFQIGMSWFKQIDTVDRDTTPAQRSLAVFNRLNEQYPDSEYAGKTKDKIAASLSNLAGHELYVADWYLRTKKYEAAIKRYEYLVENFSGTAQSKDALNRIQQARALQNQKK